MIRSTSHRFTSLMCKIGCRGPAIFSGTVLFLLIVWAAVDPPNLTVLAQEPGQWSPDAQISDYLDDTFTPYLMADQNRTVHAFANQWVGDEDRQLAIFYRQWTLEEGWTTPVDVLLSPNYGARVHGAFLDRAGMIHLVFWGGKEGAANIYYSHAPIANAGRASAWSRPLLLGEDAISTDSAALAGDDKGNLIVIYGGNKEGAGVYATQSTDAGQNWSDPKPIFLTYDPELIPFSLELFTGPSGRVHAVWNVVTSLGVDVSLYYAGLDLGSDQWSDPFLLEQKTVDDDAYFGPSFPSVVDNGKEVVVMYNSGERSTGGPVELGRPVQTVRISSDEGLNWWEPTQPFPRHVGRSGEHSLVVDGNGVVHALFTQRIESLVDGKYTIVGGIWHSEWRDDRWSEPDRFKTSLSPHDVRAVVRQGNVLLVTWREDPGAGQHGIWYSFIQLDKPELPLVTFPTPLAGSLVTPSPTPTPPTPTPTPNHRPASVSDHTVEVREPPNPATTVFLAIVPVVVLILGVVIGYQFFYRHR